MTTACPFCRQPEQLEVFDAWGHDFMLETCCEARRDLAVQDMQEDPAYARALLASGGLDGLRRVAFADEGFGAVLLDFGLRIRPCNFADAQAFVAEHHDHNGTLPMDRFRAAIWNGPTLLGVVMVGNPTTPSLMNQGLVEVRRLCLDRAVANELRWKACSALYDWSAAEAERRGWRRIITYTLASETGMSLRYTRPRWKREGEASRPGHSWVARGRGRVVGPTEAKVRWSRVLAPAVPRPIQQTFAFPRQARRRAA